MPALLNPAKLRLLDLAAGFLGMRSFADLGGVWNIAGGYTFYGAAKPGIGRAFFVDTDVASVIEKRALQPNVRMIQGNFGDSAVAAGLPAIDAVLFFNTFLHQVKADWDHILELYAGHALLVLVFNQPHTAKQTVRLLDLGREECFRNVPHSPDDEVCKIAFDHPDIHPRHGRSWRDVRHIWQWGITDDDLIAKVKSPGFGRQYYRNHGRFGNLPRFENHAFIFSRGRATMRSRLRYGVSRLAERVRLAAAPHPGDRV